ncbi:MAG: XrtA-associated ATPase [bacterium]|nr:XrtA-associated ATPase [bacterium]
MYLDFYGLKRRPFDLTPDPSFFFPSQKHTEALASLVYAVTEKRGFVVITGEIGSGKTTVCRTLLQKLDPAAKVALITNTTLTAKQLLEAICLQFGLTTDRRNKVSLLDELNRFFLERNEAGNTVVLIIDEAQNLTVRALEEMRLISNMETETQKLVQIMLLGQPELRDKLNRPDLEQLRQRISLRYHLKSLDREETQKYIEHRLSVAGSSPASGGVKFTKGAMESLYQFSRGTPRLINVVCDQALLLGYLRETRKIDEAIVKEIVAEFAMPVIEDSSRGMRGILPRHEAAGSHFYDGDGRVFEKRSVLKRLFRRKADSAMSRRDSVCDASVPEEPQERQAEAEDANSPPDEEQILSKLGTLRLAGIWAENGHFLATIDGVQLKPGDRIFGMKVADLTRDRIVFQCGERRYKLAIESNGADRNEKPTAPVPMVSRAEKAAGEKPST